MASSPPKAVPEPYPARTKSATVTIENAETVLTSISLADKLLLTISQSGRLSHWIHVPLDASVPDAPPIPSLDAEEGEEDTPQSDLLPMSHLTATTILGGRDAERETVGHLLASQIASALVSRDPEDQRVFVLGLGLDQAKLSRDAFVDIVSAAIAVL